MSRFLLVALLSVASTVDAEEAIDRTGRHRPGQLAQENGAWHFREAGGARSDVKSLSYIRFGAAAVQRLNGPQHQTLLLSDGQRLAGALVEIDEQSIVFAGALTGERTLARNQAVGVVHADDWLPIIHEDFEKPLTWKTQGPVHLAAAGAFFGKQSLKLDRAGQVLTREWPALTEGSIRLALGMSKKALASRWTIELLTPPGWTAPSLTLDADGVRAAGVRDFYGTVAVTGAWHLLAIEWGEGMLRFYVDDRCIGQSPMPGRTGIIGIRFTANQATPDSSLFVDEFTVSRRLPRLPFPRSDPKLDFVWLDQGEQLFGRVISADAHAVVLDAKFGKRSIPWSRLRGIGFARGKAAANNPDAEIEYRPGPSRSADRLQVQLIRWDQARLIVQHAVLGELAIERERLERVRFEVK